MEIPSKENKVKKCSNSKCTRAGIELPISDFRVRHTGKSQGRINSDCKLCEKQRAKDYYQRPEVKQRHNEKQKAWYKIPSNRRKVLERTRIWHNRMSVKEKSKLPTAKFWHYNHNAEKRGIQFLLDFETAEKLFLSDCNYCGAEPKPTNGIDRVDSTKGYEESNCVPCCKRCNLAKSSFPLDEFINHLKKILRHLNEQL